MKQLINKEIGNLDDIIMNLEYELNEKNHTEDKKRLIDNIIERYARLRQELIEMEKLKSIF